jgi:hypothetical protein
MELPPDRTSCFSWAFVPGDAKKDTESMNLEYQQTAELGTLAPTVTHVFTSSYPFRFSLLDVAWVLPVLVIIFLSHQRSGDC